MPVDRRSATDRADLKVFVEEQEQAAKVQSILPLPESYAPLRQLAAPYAAAWVIVPNDKGTLAAGMRVRSANLPVTPIATVPREALKSTEGRGGSAASMVQVLRNEYVTNVMVDVLGKIGSERLQVTGALRATDSLIVSSSTALLPGTLVRFTQGPTQTVEGTTPDPAQQGSDAGIAPPSRGQSAVSSPASGRSPAGLPPAGQPVRPPVATPPSQAGGQGQGSPPF